MNKETTFSLINLVFFQAVWFVTVIGAAQGHPWLGFLALGVFLIAHKIFSTSATTDYQLAAIAVLFGVIIETVFVRTGILSYPHYFPAAQFAPAWVLILWANLALTLNGCLRWLQGRYLLAAALGAIGGPLAYLGGISLGAAATGTSPSIAFGVFAITYGIVIPTLLLLAKRLLAQNYQHRFRRFLSWT